MRRYAMWRLILFPPTPEGNRMSSSSLHRLPTPAARLDDVLAELAARFATIAAAHDADGTFPHDNFAQLHGYGLIAQVVPAAHGGAGAGLAQARRIIAAVAGGDAATALVLTMTYLQHRAIGRADSLYTTGIPALRWLAVWARTHEPEPRVGIFLVPRPDAGTPGIRVIESWDHLGLRASGSHETVFEDVWIPLENAVDIRPPAAWAPAGGSQADIDANADQQAWMVTLLGSLYDAVARAGFDWVGQFVRERAPGSLGKPLATLPRVQESIGEIAALLRVNQVLLDDIAARCDAGAPPLPADSGLLKYTVTSNAIRAVELALQLSGNHGLSRHNPLQRHYRDVLCSRIHTPQNDAILTAAGRAALGI